MMIPKCEAPKILAFDTSSHSGSAAILSGPEVLAEMRINSRKTHSSMLLKSVDFLLQQTGLKLKDMNLIASGIGPGSFTGIRIGVSTALGLAQTLSIPFAGISGLDVVAHQIGWLEGSISVLLDAHRNQYYIAEYLCHKKRIRSASRPALIPASDLKQIFMDRMISVIGNISSNQWDLYGKGAAHWPQMIPADLFLAAGIGRLALIQKSKWRSGEFLASEPLYIRPPDAIKNRIGKR